MSKTIKTIASIALPIIGTVVAPGIGTALGSTLSASTLATVGGAVGGALGGGVASDWSPAGVALGGATGALTSGAGSELVGTAAGTPLATATGNAALQGPTMGSGIMGAVTGGGTQALTQGLSSTAAGGLARPLLTSIGNQLVATSAEDTAKEAAGIQSAAVDRAIAQAQPYAQAGTEALGKISSITENPSAYIQNNPLYSTLAQDAQRRLLASEAAKGRVASGGTAAALQDRLMQVGSGLVQQELGTLQNTANAGQAAATTVADLLTQQGDVRAAGTVGGTNALTSSYQNQINTLLALQSLGNSPSYTPSTMLQR